MNKTVKTILKWTFAALFAFTAAASASLGFGIEELASYGVYSEDGDEVMNIIDSKVDSFLASRALSAAIHPGEESLPYLFSAVNGQGLEFKIISGEDDVVYATSGFSEDTDAAYISAGASDRYVFFSDITNGFSGLKLQDLLRGAGYWFADQPPYIEETEQEAPDTEEQSAARYLIYYYRDQVLPDGGLYAQAEQMAYMVVDFASYAAVAAVISACISLVSLMGSVILAGNKETRSHKIPYLFLIVIFGGFFVLCTLIAREFATEFFFDDIFLGMKMLIIPAFAAAFAGALFLINTAERIKSRSFYKNTLLSRLVSLVSILLGDIPLVASVVAGFIVVSVIQIIGIAFALDGDTDITIAGLILYKIVEIVLLGIFTVYVSRISRGITKVSGGDFEEPVNTSGMIGPFKKAAVELNGISDSLNKAVDERMKSERMKAELITNVSHDIKTPLTSIINYVDLLKGQDVHNETAAEYIEVIDRHAGRLKKLTEDLVEASKASTGNVEISLEDIDAKVFLSQIEGEFEERLQKRDLTAVINCPPEDIFVKADGRCLWRVIENIMVNAGKYAMSGTRFYIDLTRDSGNAVFSFKNISAEELNISADELKARFVRGDRSRNTEGSGLGLSIAEDLTTLMGGRLDLSIDGDLFKVTVSLPEGQGAAQPKIEGTKQIST